MTRRPVRALSVSVLTCALVLTGCTKQTPTGSSPSSVQSATTTTDSSAADTASASTTGDSDALAGQSGTFTVVPPEGWSDATSQAGGVAGLEIVLLSSQRVAKFSNNLVVTSSTGDPSVLEAELAKGRSEMAAAGRTVSAAPDQVVGGINATGFTTAFEQQGVKVVARSYGLHRNGRIYLLTLSSSQEDADGAMAELDEIVSTWAWT